MKKIFMGIGVVCLLLILLAIGEFGVFILTSPSKSINSIVNVEHLNVTKEAIENNSSLREYVNESISAINCKGETTTIYFHKVD